MLLLLFTGNFFYLFNKCDINQSRVEIGLSINLILMEFSSITHKWMENLSTRITCEFFVSVIGTTTGE